MSQFSIYILAAIFSLSSTNAFAQAGSDAAASAAVAANQPPLVAEGYTPQEAMDALNGLKGVLKAWPEADVNAEVANVRKDLQLYMESQAECRAKEDRANYFCIEARNPDVQKYTMIAQALAAGISGMADSCSKWGKIMSLGNAALGAYQAQCGTWKGMCSSSCSTSVKAVQAAKKDIDALVASFATKTKAVAASYRARQMEAAAVHYDQGATELPRWTDSLKAKYLDRELNVAGDYKAVAKKLQTCNGYAAQLATSALGIVGMLKSMSGADQCADDSTNSGLATPTPVDCTVAANKTSNMTCICADAPRTAGCSTGLDSAAATKSADSMRTASTSDYVPTKSDSKVSLGGDDANKMDLSSKGTDGGSGSPGAPMGGGSAGLGGGGGSGSSAGTAAAQKAAGLNTNILGGEGGGGGGGSWGSGGGDAGLRQFLPGGAKDPTAGVAGQAGAAKEVTAPGGKSNWEKVRDRYRDNKSSLIGF